MECEERKPRPNFQYAGERRQRRRESEHGAVAQLGERLNRTQEVGGPNPPSSTNLLAHAIRLPVLGHAGRIAFGGAASLIMFLSLHRPLSDIS